MGEGGLCEGEAGGRREEGCNKNVNKVNKVFLKIAFF